MPRRRPRSRGQGRRVRRPARRRRSGRAGLSLRRRRARTSSCSSTSPRPRTSARRSSSSRAGPPTTCSSRSRSAAASARSPTPRRCSTPARTRCRSTRQRWRGRSCSTSWRPRSARSASCSRSTPSRARASGWEAFVAGGRTPTGRDAVQWAREGVERGAGEILLTSMDRDGTNAGYDLGLTGAVADAVGVPVIASGGAGALDHLTAALEAGADAVLCASIFHYGQHTVARSRQRSPTTGCSIRPVDLRPRSTRTRCRELASEGRKIPRPYSAKVRMFMLARLKAAAVRRPLPRIRRRRMHRSTQQAGRGAHNSQGGNKSRTA